MPLAATLLLLCLAGSAQTVPFTHVVIDEHAPQNLWGKAAGDLDGDGRADLIAGGWSSGGLVWYRNPDWRKSVIDARSKIGTDVEVADIDRDGKPDLVAITSTGAVWYRNPDWTPHPIARDTLHDLELADLDLDGDLDIVARNQGAFKGPSGKTLFFYFQDQPARWRTVTREIVDGEGLALADLDRDGDPDPIVNGSWYENTGPEPAAWPRHPYTSAYSHPHVFIATGDFNGDRRRDLALSPSELKGGRYRISWFEAPRDPRRSPWTEHIVEQDVETVVHSIAAADFNLDGKLDLAAANMLQGDPPRPVRIFFNLGRGRSWRTQTLAETGSHSMRVVDLDGNGAPSLFGGNHQSSKLELWRNALRRP